MATNPNNAIGTNAAYGGRTSANAFNDVTSGFARGILNGWNCVPNSGLTVSIGGDGSTRDVAVAENNTGDKISINNISNSPVDVTIGAAPASNSRIDAIVAYVDNPPQGESTVADNPEACGLIVVPGIVASSPSAPSENAIRTAITADGASGTTAYYVVLAYVTIPSGTTDIVADNITAGPNAQLSANNVDFSRLRRGAFVAAGANFIAPTAGYYIFRANISTSNFGSSATATVNGSILWRAQWNGPLGEYNMQFDQTLFLLAGDSIVVSTTNGAVTSNYGFAPVS
jgi:hypothetical protein